MLLLTQDVRRILHRDSTQRVAALLGIDAAVPQEQLLDAIRNHDPESFQALHAFLEAWDRWYSFHERIDASGVAGRLTAEQYKELVARVAERDRARAILIRRTRELELRHVTIRIPPDSQYPGRELDLAARIRRDLYGYSAIEIDPDDARFATRRDANGWVSFAFTTAFSDSVVNGVLARFGYLEKEVKLEIRPATAAETKEECLSCGEVYDCPMPTFCAVCGFRDVSPCPACGEEIPRRSYIKKNGGNRFVCPSCAAEVRLRLNDPVVDSDARYAEPLVLVEQAAS